MQIINSNFKKGQVKLKINDPEDLWYLSHLIDLGDLVTGKATRKIKIGESENAAAVKKIMTLQIEAETVELTPEGDVLRVNGKIVQEHEEAPKGSYQALALEKNSEFLLEKPQWLEYQKQKLKEATEKKYTYLLCLFDREEALLALTKNFGYKILGQIAGEVTKKRAPAEKKDLKKDFYLEIIKVLEEYAQRYLPERIILASPAFYKEDLFKKITSPELKKKIVLAICSDISERGLDEVLKRPELAETLRSSRTRQEELLVDELLNEISKENLAAYGWKEVLKASEAGAIHKLLVTQKFLKKKREENKFDLLDELMKKVDSLQGEVHLLSSEQEGGRKLDGLGGIAALLRYKLSWK